MKRVETAKGPAAFYYIAVIFKSPTKDGRFCTSREADRGRRRLRA